MLKKLMAILSNPNWLNVIIGIIGLIGIGAIVKFWRGILNIFPHVAKIIENTIITPLGIFSAILFSLLFLFWIFLFRHEVRKVKVATGVLILLSLAGFIVSGLVHVDYRIPEDATPMITELRKEKEALQRELVTTKETIRQKENENVLVKREKEKLGKEVEIQKNQSKVYGDTIAQKDKEISNLNKQLSDSLSESKKLANRISLLEKENRDFQVEISSLKKSSILQQVRFEHTNKKLSLIEGDKRKELLTDYSILEYSASKGRKKIAVIGEKASHYCLIVFNADRDLTDLSVWEIEYHANTPPKNLKWVSDTVLRIDLISYFQQGAYPKFNNISLEGTGTYDITINEINSLMTIKRVDIGRK